MISDFEFYSENDAEWQFSRRNEVCVIRNSKGHFVLKRYSDETSFYTEIQNLSFLSSKNVQVPIIYCHDKTSLILQHIRGLTYEQVLMDAESGKISQDELLQAANALCKWLKSYYIASDSLRGDVNFRNFIFTGDKTCYGIDFEVIFEKGDYESDIGRIIAYASTYEPPFTQIKLMFCREIFKFFIKDGLDSLKIKEEYFKEFKAMKQRREPFDLDKQAPMFWKSINNE